MHLAGSSKVFPRDALVMHLAALHHFELFLVDAMHVLAVVGEIAEASGTVRALVRTFSSVLADVDLELRGTPVWKRLN